MRDNNTIEIGLNPHERESLENCIKILSTLCNNLYGGYNRVVVCEDVDSDHSFIEVLNLIHTNSGNIIKCLKTYSKQNKLTFLG